MLKQRLDGNLAVERAIRSFYLLFILFSSKSSMAKKISRLEVAVSTHIFLPKKGKRKVHNANASFGLLYGLYISLCPKPSHSSLSDAAS